MKLVFFNNSLNHHQVNVADEFYNILGGEYAYVSTVAKNKAGLKGGVDYSDRPYCIMAGDSKASLEKAMNLSKTADVCVFGAESLSYAIERAKKNPKGLSFELSERWLKRGWLNILSPRLIRWWVAYQRYFRNANFYKLNASAFAAKDHWSLLSYRNRCYKWGYFTERSNDLSIKEDRLESKTVRLMWCSRFIDWKHPEMAIECAKKLKENGFEFQLDMYGDGVMRDSMMQKVESCDLKEFVFFHGNLPNEQIHDAMDNHEIFLFTSDKEEGWGVVANEAMSHGCCLVGSDEIGSVPFLVKDKETGLVFYSKNVDSLYEKVVYLIENLTECNRLAKNGNKYIKEVWSPVVAAKNLLQLIDDLQNGRDGSIKEGPGSIAELI